MVKDLKYSWAMKTMLLRQKYQTLQHPTIYISILSASVCSSKQPFRKKKSIASCLMSKLCISQIFTVRGLMQQARGVGDI